jgi:hypothetical protein
MWLLAASGGCVKRVQKSLWFWQMRECVSMLHTHSGTLEQVVDSLIGLHCLEQQDMSRVYDS